MRARSPRLPSVLAASLVVLAGLAASCSSSDSGGGEAAPSGGSGGAGSDAGDEGDAASGADADAAANADAEADADGATSSDAPADGDGAVGCVAPDTCTVAARACAGLVDNAQQPRPGLRIAALASVAPAALGQGVVGSVLSDAVTPTVQGCGLHGSARTSWLLRVDPGAGTLELGGAKPVADPTQGYAFDDETIASGASSFHVQPHTWTATLDASGALDAPMGGDVVLPVFLDAAATQVVLVPLRDLTVHAQLDASRSCIGGFDPAAFDAANGCAVSDPSTIALQPGGTLTGVITLEEADNVIVTLIGESLCVLLSGDPATYGDGGHPERCKRTNGVIAFQGDTCSIPGLTCKDAVTFSAAFAASSVAITN